MIKKVTGYRENEPDREYTVKVALGEWNGIEDAADEAIFYYMDGAPLEVGCTISEDFVVTSVEEI